jgi:hypothetical protein
MLFEQTSTRAERNESVSNQKNPRVSKSSFTPKEEEKEGKK